MCTLDHALESLHFTSKTKFTGLYGGIHLDFAGRLDAVQESILDHACQHFLVVVGPANFDEKVLIRINLD